MGSYRKRRERGLCGFCGLVASVTNYCDDCLRRRTTQQRERRSLRYTELVSTRGDRRQAGRVSRALGWALAQHRLR